MYINTYPADELYHFGIPGMKWGIRRFQNQDGSLTPAGRERYGFGGLKDKFRGAASSVRSAGGRATSAIKRKWNGLSDRQKKVIKGVAITAGVAVAAYGAYKLSQVPAIKNSKAMSALRKAGSTAISNVKESAQWFKNGRQIGKSGGSVVDGLTGTRRNDVITRLGAKVGSAQNSIGSAVKGAFGKTKTAIGDFAKNVKYAGQDLKWKMTDPEGKVAGMKKAVSNAVSDTKWKVKDSEALSRLRNGYQTFATTGVGRNVDQAGRATGKFLAKQGRKIGRVAGDAISSAPKYGRKVARIAGETAGNVGRTIGSMSSNQKLALGVGAGIGAGATARTIINKKKKK